MNKAKLLIGTSLLGLTALSSPSTLAQSRTNYIELDGKSQYISIASRPELDIPLGSSYTISWWMWGNRAFIYGEPMRILSRRDLGLTDSLNRSGYEILGMRTMSDTFLGASLPDGAGRYTSSLDGWGAAPSASYIFHWYHGAMVVDRTAGTITLYVDGKQVLQQTEISRAWSAVNTLPLLIGAGQRDGKATNFFAGRLDNVRLYDRALSVDELLQDRETERIAPDTKGLVAAFDFENYRSGDTELRDATGRITAQLHGFPKRLDHALVKTFDEHATNASLIGRGTREALRTFTLGLHAPAVLERLTVTTGADLARSVRALRLYVTENGDRYDPRTPGILIAEGKPSGATTTLTRVKRAPQITAQSRLWLVADVRPSANEGTTVTTEIESIELAGAPAFRPVGNIKTQHEIVLERTLMWAPGERKSASYRIPSIVRLANGNLVAAVDHRKNSDYDLPADIDIEVKISRDNGKTWSQPITVAKGTPEHGYGDAAMTTDGKNIYMVMIAGSGLWFYPSAADKPLEMYFTMSSDGGRTWTPARDITQQVYTDRYPNGGFFGSGNGIITSKGRIAFVAAMRVDATWGGAMDNVMVYSDDLGKTWQASPVARTNGDEAKILELADGDLLISSRNRERFTPRTYVRSSDHGMTWSQPAVWEELVGNNCNAALTRYSLERDGKGSKNIILHTLLASPTRDHLRIYMSEDEGKTWPISRTLCTGEAAYSEVVPLGDGTIGIISEEDDRPAYDIYFTRVSLDWLRRGDSEQK